MWRVLASSVDGVTGAILWSHPLDARLFSHPLNLVPRATVIRPPAGGALPLRRGARAAGESLRAFKMVLRDADYSVGRFLSSQEVCHSGFNSRPSCCVGLVGGPASVEFKLDIGAGVRRHGLCR